MYTIGIVKGLSKNETTSIRELVEFVLPQDYLTFLTEYGYGEINETLFFQNPDAKYMKNNFSEYMDLWEWENEAQKESTLSGLTIATTIDGDIVCCVNNYNSPYLLLPRHSEKPIKFDNLMSLFSDYYKSENLYFDTYFNAERKIISLAKNGQLDQNLINKIQKLFLEKYQFDRVLKKETQPKYVMQEIGGWVYFDLIYKSSIRVKYQTIFELKAKNIIDFIELQT